MGVPDDLMVKKDELQDKLAEICVGYPLPSIMWALTGVTGAMIGLHAPDPAAAASHAKLVAEGIEAIAVSCFDAPEFEVR